MEMRTPGDLVRFYRCSSWLCRASRSWRCFMVGSIYSPWIPKITASDHRTEDWHRRNREARDTSPSTEPAPQANTPLGENPSIPLEDKLYASGNVWLWM